MLITKEVEVKISRRTKKYYQEKGYGCEYDSIISVKAEDLPPKSGTEVSVLCDYCNKQINTIKYRDYTASVNIVPKYACKNCIDKKREEVIYKKYGVFYSFDIDGVQEKIIQTNLDKYGVSNPLSSKECQLKQRNTCLEKYGVPNYRMTDECSEKIKTTCLQRYGVENPSSNSEIKEKIKNNNFKKYGVEYTLSSPIIRERIKKTLYQNKLCASSLQQIYLHNIFGGELNYPILYYNSDICLLKEKIDIEYDGGGHDLQVKLGSITQEEFNQKEIIRNNIIKHEGYKQIRIISSKDYLPSDEILLQMLDQAKEYFNTTNHTWIEYNIDSSTMRNAENKEGVYYKYGELRKIKKVS